MPATTAVLPLSLHTVIRISTINELRVSYDRTVLCSFDRA